MLTNLAKLSTKFSVFERSRAFGFVNGLHHEKLCQWRPEKKYASEMAKFFLYLCFLVGMKTPHLHDCLVLSSKD